MISPISRHNQLAALIQLDLLFFAIFRQKTIASPRELSFKTIGGIVKSGVQDTAIPAARTQPTIGLFFYEMHRRIGESTPQSSRNVQSDYSAADYEKIRLQVFPANLPTPKAPLE